MSDLEDDLVERIRVAGLPPPAREFPFPGVRGDRRWRFDLAWVSHRVAVEVDGGGWVRGRHCRPKGFESDCEKHSQAVACGWRLLRVTTRMIESGDAVDLIRRALLVAVVEGVAVVRDGASLPF